MKHVNIKFSAVTRSHSLTQREFPPGLSGNVSVYRVENVPDGVAGGAVLRLFMQTIIPFPDQLPTPYTVGYQQLGAGKVIAFSRDELGLMFGESYLLLDGIESHLAAVRTQHGNTPGISAQLSGMERLLKLLGENLGALQSRADDVAERAHVAVQRANLAGGAV